MPAPVAVIGCPAAAYPALRSLLRATPMVEALGEWPASSASCELCQRPVLGQHGQDGPFGLRKLEALPRPRRAPSEAGPVVGAAGVVGRPVESPAL